MSEWTYRGTSTPVGWTDINTWTYKHGCWILIKMKMTFNTEKFAQMSATLEYCTYEMFILEKVMPLVEGGTPI